MREQTPQPDPLIAQISARQHGNITLKQLVAAGVSRQMVAYRVRLGRLFPVFRNVYAVGRPPRTPLERACAAVLACGPTALLSHASAASLWGFQTAWTAPFHVTTAADRRPAGVRTHRSVRLTRAERRRQLGIAVTSPARTLLDWAPDLPDQRLSRALNDARLSGLLRIPDLQATLERFPRHPGAQRLRPLLADPGRGPTRSEFEDAFIAFCAEYELPKPQVNVIVAGYEVDVFFPEQGLIVELDGYAFHQGRRSFESDRERDANTLQAGFPTVRVTWARFTKAPAREAKRLRVILERLSRRR